MYQSNSCVGCSCHVRWLCGLRQPGYGKTGHVRVLLATGDQPGRADRRGNRSGVRAVRGCGAHVVRAERRRVGSCEKPPPASRGEGGVQENGIHLPGAGQPGCERVCSSGRVCVRNAGTPCVRGERSTACRGPRARNRPRGGPTFLAKRGEVGVESARNYRCCHCCRKRSWPGQRADCDGPGQPGGFAHVAQIQSG
ncbi:MAG: hypothetical protein BWY06_01356 [Candidatus Latescibacteria bacterium ADurb.Bin168]|nr:MAG: hypothetical protein BWY06_01356 [Candidatus Latescibacteria bacterium ADurb.Bin168]